MRRVLKHHVCFCFLSTALLAGVSLIAAQEKVYAGSLGNCKGDVDGGDGSKPIVCDGSVMRGDGVLSDDWNIDMSNYIGWPAVKVYGDADITMSGTLRVTGSSDNDSPAIKVHGGGGLKLVDATIVNVSKGIVAESEGAVTVMTGLIGVKKDGVVVEVKNRGKVTLMGTSFTKVTMGAEVKGDGKLKMTGGEIRVTSTNGGTGLSVGGTGSAIMMGGMIVGKGGETSKGVVMMGTGTVELNKVEVESFLTGVEIKSGTSGTVTLTGGSMIKAAGDGGVGIKVEGGTLKINGESTIEAKGTHGVGIKIMEGNGSVTMVGGKIQGHGNGSGQGVGVDMAGDGTVELTKVTVLGFETGVKVSKGKVTISGESAITAKGQNAVGVEVKGTGVLKINGESTITAEGDNGVGVRITETGKAEVIGATIKGNGGRSGTSKGVVVDTLSEEGVKLTNVTIESFATGMEVKKGTVKISGESKITGISTGLSVQGGTVTMMGGKISGGGSGQGVGVSGTGKAELKDVEISKATTGVTMSGGTFKMIRGSIKGGETGTGVDISGKGEVTLEDVEIEGVTTGVSVSEEASGTLTVKKGEIKEFTTAGVNVEEGAVVVNVDGTKIMGKGGGNGYGVYVGSKVTGEVTLTNVTVSQVATGVYVKSGATKAELTLTGVTIEGVEKGVQMLGGKKLTMTGGSIGFTRMGVMVQDGEAKLMNVKITGSGGGNGGTGVYATGGEVTLTDVEISKVGTGVMMSGGGTLMMTKGEIKGFTTAGVSVGISVTRADLTGTIITGKGSGTGVKVEDRATASLTLTDVMVSEVATGVEMNGTGALTVKGGTIKGVQTGIDMSGSGALMISGSSTIQFTSDNGYGVKVGGEVTKADLTNVTVTGKDNKGVGVYAMGGRTMVMTLTDVKISEVTTGLYMMGKGELTVSGNSTTINFAGGYGVYVGDKVKSATNEDGD
ncbi:hypothetical protein BWD121_000820 [Bartonella sp. WD12.1]|nr:hypothetical protein BWD121_000820 [Bartonella sp. WD12.1]